MGRDAGAVREPPLQQAGLRAGPGWFDRLTMSGEGLPLRGEGTHKGRPYTKPPERFLGSAALRSK